MDPRTPMGCAAGASSSVPPRGNLAAEPFAEAPIRPSGAPRIETRRAQAKTLAELKGPVAFEAIPRNDRSANAAWQLPSAWTLDLAQLRFAASRRARVRIRRCERAIQRLAACNAAPPRQLHWPA